jgi:hypothetical protein
MNIELKNVRLYKEMSEETYCFKAMLYKDGKRMGEVENRGTGGCHSYEFSREEAKEMDEWCGANLPKWGSRFGDGDIYETSLEQHISELVEAYENKKDMTSLLRRKIVVVDDTRKEGEYFHYNKAKYKGREKELYSYILSKKSPFKNPVILNKLDVVEACAKLAGE